MGERKEETGRRGNWEERKPGGEETRKRGDWEDQEHKGECEWCERGEGASAQGGMMRKGELEESETGRKPRRVRPVGCDKSEMGGARESARGTRVGEHKRRESMRGSLLSSCYPVAIGL